MNGDEKKLYRELVNERENTLDWFRTPPWLRERTAQEIDLANRVLAEYEATRQRAKREHQIHVQEEKREHELLSTIPDPEETLWSLEMREHTRMAYCGKNRKKENNHGNPGSDSRDERGHSPDGTE